MIGRDFSDLYFQTFYVSRETSNSPLLVDIMKIIKNFEEKRILIDSKLIISLSYGKRILINGNYSDISKINVDNFLEIVDYDPIKKIVLAIGKNEPCIETPLHWHIHNARTDINAVIQISGDNIAQKSYQNIPSTEKEWPIGTLELVKEVLKSLRNSKKILIKNIGTLFVGINLKEAEKLALKTYEESL
jgi:hypothetical protein